MFKFWRKLFAKPNLECGAPPQPPETDLSLYKVSRVPCPFYGFVAIPVGKNYLGMDSGGNACFWACLQNSSHSPCIMEVIEKREPHWKQCGYNTPENVEFMETNMLDRTRFHPQTLPDKEGVGLRTWYEQLAG